ncbi:MAG: hypothetical protein N4J56_008031 [Chroococcidiopsis sp. SAG 2025]|nr:hypothetical protein [Chroococcidiopsis sp. SAG 2025]
MAIERVSCALAESRFGYAQPQQILLTLSPLVLQSSAEDLSDICLPLTTSTVIGNYQLLEVLRGATESRHLKAQNLCASFGTQIQKCASIGKVSTTNSNRRSFPGRLQSSKVCYYLCLPTILDSLPIQIARSTSG